jgi:hypothetical protein
VGGEARLLREWSVGKGGDETTPISQVCALSADGELLLVRLQTSPEELEVWDVPAGTKRWTVKAARGGDRGNIHCSGEFSADGRRLYFYDAPAKKVVIYRLPEGAGGP